MTIQNENTTGVRPGLAADRLEPSVTFVTCIEAGPLEEQVVRLADSLRTWGGRFRDCPILAIRPRFGPPLSASTRRELRALGVDYLRINPRNDYPWLGFFNKPLCVVAAEDIARTEALAWLDGDILVIGEPEELLPGAGEDFTACASDRGGLGSSGSGDPNEPYWRSIYESHGLSIDALPWVTTWHEGIPIRLYWNSGVFAYRRSTSFGASWLACCRKLLRDRIIPRACGVFFTDQVALSIAMLKASLTWRALPYSYNYSLCSVIRDCLDPERLRTARILHYRDAMWPRVALWPELLRMLESTRPDVGEWLARRGPLINRSSIPSKALGKYLRMVRRWRLSTYEAGCHAIGPCGYRLRID
jgi:hypothetical protein